MDFGPYASFIGGAYGFAALVLGALIVNGWRDGRAQRRALAALQDERGEQA
ncbi:heme exporter protein CcmD [Methylorubrum zatmanii]|uniref:Heme exporter protein D n=2 Tax=Methylorubrum TaxID=2282523 RepID=A0A921E2L8_9HYPH|nr:heme exporter protein CcmD [Methylorubrum zatmanii]MBD8907093.1 heme exporter protein CcmD [Methylorubrum zatmanii]HJE23327.1 heme exporter protein CcmD [Methylorubrum populi]